MRRARGVDGGGGAGRQGLAPELAPRCRGGATPATTTTRPLPLLLAPLPPPPSTSRLRELSQRSRASTPDEPEWGPSTSGRRSDTTRAKASSSSSSNSSTNSVSPPLPSSRSFFPNSAVLASLSAGSLDEALRRVLLEALSTVEGFRDASEESWSELMRRPAPLDGDGSPRSLSQPRPLDPTSRRERDLVTGPLSLSLSLSLS